MYLPNVIIGIIWVRGAKEALNIRIIYNNNKKYRKKWIILFFNIFTRNRNYFYSYFARPDIKTALIVCGLANGKITNNGVQNKNFYVGWIKMYTHINYYPFGKYILYTLRFLSLSLGFKLYPCNICPIDSFS